MIKPTLRRVTDCVLYWVSYPYGRLHRTTDSQQQQQRRKPPTPVNSIRIRTKILDYCLPMRNVWKGFHSQRRKDGRAGKFSRGSD
ncbi:hypothetical protein I7I53_11802 [Histoplasma capsulatum var. duboisii H88]|uniref:Uncharacterized protein n=1 Tax=Ajellomyces capsulatus (strain H88) TaxID=544711 RepID=A0A8A1LTZ6_AJEC8|nr:hypothetical protein I7I53_11802 [Histoplasma capsulatum var. duboisii H88]